MRKPELQIGDVKEVEFIKGDKGSKPICRIDGVIGVLNSKVAQFVAPRSVWAVSITAVNSKFVVVNLIDKVKTPWENLRDVDNAITKAFSKPKKERRKKVKYPNI